MNVAAKRNLALGAALEPLEQRVLFSAGVLDTANYNPTLGYLIQHYRSTNDGVDVALQSDGKAIMVGDTQQSGATKDAFITRINTNGSVDTTFATNGVAFLDLGSDEIATGVKIQSDGKIVMCGLSGNLSANQGDFFVARYNTNGSLDTTFNGTGKLVIDFGGLDAGADLVIDPDTQHIIVTGVSASVTGGGIAMAFINTNGSLISSSKTNEGLGIIEGATAIVESGGNFYVTGFSLNALSSKAKMMIAELDGQGNLVDSFGDGGRAFASLGGNVELGVGIAVDPTTGNFVITGATANGIIDAPPGLPEEGSASHATVSDFAVARFTPSGNLDTSFGGKGQLKLDFNGQIDGASDVVVQTDGKVIIAGGTENSKTGDSDIAMARFTVDGKLDKTFGADGKGKVITDLGASDGSFAIEIGADGLLYMVGHTKRDAGDGDAVILRYLIEQGPAPVTVTIDDVQKIEGNDGTTGFTFTVNLNHAATAPVTVKFATANDTTDASDFAGQKGVLTFNVNDTSKAITVLVNGDTTPETDEDFLIKLSGAKGARIGKMLGIGTILHDDGDNNLIGLSAPSVQLPVEIIGGTAGATGTANVVITNTSANPIKGKVLLSIFGSQDDVLNQQSDLLLGSVMQKISLAAGATRTVPVKLKFPFVFDDSDLKVIAAASGAGIINSNASAMISANAAHVETAMITLEGQQNPDPITVHSGTQAGFGFTLLNTGNIAAVGSVSLHVTAGANGSHYYWWDSGHGPTGNDFSMTSKSARIAIPANGSGRVALSLKIPPGTNPGDDNFMAPGTYELDITILTSHLLTDNSTNGQIILRIPFTVV